jgi:hypothetical protein
MNMCQKTSKVFRYLVSAFAPGELRSLANIAAINALLNNAEKIKATKPIKDFITDYLGRMPFVEDRRTEAVMEMVNIAIELPYSPSSFPGANPERCVMDDLTPILAHCMQLSIATSWDFLPKPPVIDDYCNLEHVSPLANACAVMFSPDARTEFADIRPSGHRN